jgi:sugar phosphate isomerase/epimerase
MAPMVDKLQAIVAGRDLTYTVHGPLSASFMDRRALDWHKAAVAAMLEICELIGAGVMVLHTGRPPSATADDIAHLHAMERDALRELGDVAGKHGVTLALENLWVATTALYTAPPVRLAEHIREIDHAHVAGTLDISHAYLQTSHLGLDFVQEIEAFAEIACHLHIHDSFGRPGDRNGFPSEQMAFGVGDLHLPIGWGDIDWETILPKLGVRPETIFMIEMPPHFWENRDHCAEQAKALVPLVGRDKA